MGRNLSPVIRRELANLDKDADSRKSAMKALKCYVKDLDSKAIPQFLAQVSETKGSGLPSGEHTISLYEVLARVHGRNIVPQIDNIMSTIVKTLMTSAGSFPLHQACSKVVPSIARYAIDPLTPDGEKLQIIQSLCRPLSAVLMGSPESVPAGAALCLKALVECDNWRFASDDVVNDLCLRVASSLEENLTQTNSHMGLAMSLSKHNSLTVEPYARSLIRSGLHILATDVAEGNSQKRFSAIQMINFLMKCVDSRSISSELMKVVEMMEKCYSDDHMPFVRAAAFEALQTAKMIVAEKGNKSEKSSSSVSGSNFSRRNCNRNNSESVDDNHSEGVCRSPRYGSPESHNVDSFIGYNCFPDSPLSTGQVSCNLRYGRPMSRRLWMNEIDGVNVSLKDGLYSKAASGGACSEAYTENFNNGELSDLERDEVDGFSGFVHAYPTSRDTRSATPSPQKTRTQLHVDDIRIFSTPRKLIHSLQDSDEANFDLSAKKGSKIRSPISNDVGWSPSRQMWKNGIESSDYDAGCKRNLQRESEMCYRNDAVKPELEPDGHESVSSTGDSPLVTDCKESEEVRSGEKDELLACNQKRNNFKKTTFGLVFGLSLILPAIIFSAMWIDDQEYFNLVPT